MKKKIAVIGAGNSGLAMAAYLLYNNFNISLWNRSFQTIEKIQKTGKIHCEGVISGSFSPSLITTDISKALEDKDLVLITTPANAHKEIAALLAPFVRKEMVIILNPGRTFGAIEFRRILEEKQTREMPIIAESQTILFTCRKIVDDTVNILEIKNRVLISTVSDISNSDLVAILPQCLKMAFSPARSIIETSLGNVGLVLHCAPVLLNIGWIEYPNIDFKYYYNGITPSIAQFIAKLDAERVEVSKRLGCEVETLVTWLKRSYNAEGFDIFSCIQNVECYKVIDAPQSLNHRYLFEDVPTGLVPLEDLGNSLGIDMKICTLIINLANSVLDVDFRQSGRTLSNLGINIKELQMA